jgi:hypothetical protein
MKISVAWSKEPEGVNGVAVGRCPKGEDKEPRKEQGHKVPTMGAIFGGIPGFQDMMTYKPTAAMGRTRGAGSECPKIRLEYCYDGRKI